MSLVMLVLVKLQLCWQLEHNEYKSCKQTYWCHRAVAVNTDHRVLVVLEGREGRLRREEGTLT